MHEHQPIYKSKKFIAYFFTVAVMLAALLMGAPDTVVEHLAAAIAYGFPVLLGGQAAVDAITRRNPPAAASAMPKRSTQRLPPADDESQD